VRILEEYERMIRLTTLKSVIVLWSQHPERVITWVLEARMRETYPSSLVSGV
jgi:hypothetical protein